jgi:hypothetical protein
VENDFDGMIAALQARKIDAILSDMSVTPKMLQQIDFTSKVSFYAFISLTSVLRLVKVPGWCYAPGSNLWR